MLERGASYAAVRDRFAWRIPQAYNIGADVVDRHAAVGNAPALVFEDEAGSVRRLGFRDVAEASNRFANALVAMGLGRGDRLGILLSQGPETAIAHVAAYKAGLIAVPLFTLFGPEALEYRL
ncbi:MAG: AMP-binding protein, partial [Alphaproteobacteria bacterium]|nr:AMP-binding protein [Alphaproteobacteria bacterium]